jgi:hypothetical protein
MPEDKYSTEIYSEKYLALMDIAISESLALGFMNAPRVGAAEYISNEVLESTQKLAFDRLYPDLYKILPRYWGNSCQTLSTHVFAYLTSIGIRCDIVIGEVEVNGTLEFDTTLSNLKHEYQSPVEIHGGQYLHAWVSLGGDTIIDAGLPDRMIKNYKFPEKYMPPIMVGRASEISRKFRAQHQPLLIGTDFLAKTNSYNPLDILKKYSAL